MDKPILTDEKIFPTEKIISTHLGKAYSLWQTFFTEMRADHPDFVEEWRYYNDGKSWLMKITRKKKTVVWVTVHDGMFRSTAYLTEKAREAVEASALSDSCKEQFLKGKRFGKLVAVTVKFKKKADLKDARALLDLKMAMK
jgi:hypothetical protein